MTGTGRDGRYGIDCSICFYLMISPSGPATGTLSGAGTVLDSRGPT